MERERSLGWGLILGMIGFGYVIPLAQIFHSKGGIVFGLLVFVFLAFSFWMYKSFNLSNKYFKIIAIVWRC